ncbi:MAG: ammonium transporter, partial [Candidatus Caldatribacterium sp.]|nr:ammonium transporter [Candidatus Caldatribacterium sp.]
RQMCIRDRPCAWIEAWAAVVIGAVAGLLVVWGVYFLESHGVDDPVGAVSVHGVNGLWGLASVGLFADGTYGLYSLEPPYVTGLFYGGGVGQLLAQLIGIAVVTAWAFGLGYLLFRVMDLSFGIRVSPEEELQGLDIHEHGTPAYPEFTPQRTMLVS